MSILTSIKQMLGIDAEYTHFDTDIIMHINGALMILSQLGINANVITDDTATWEAYIGTDNNLELLKLYVYYKTRLGFDPPSSAFVLDAMENQIKEIEWRIMVQVDPPIEEV